MPPCCGLLWGLLCSGRPRSCIAGIASHIQGATAAKPCLSGPLSHRPPPAGLPANPKPRQITMGAGGSKAAAAQRAASRAAAAVGRPPAAAAAAGEAASGISAAGGSPGTLQRS